MTDDLVIMDTLESNAIPMIKKLYQKGIQMQEWPMPLIKIPKIYQIEVIPYISHNFVKYQANIRTMRFNIGYPR